MTSPGGLGLARVTIAAPKRRMDVALPEHLLVVELLPYLLRHAGDDLADAGERHGGWVLRRATGAVLDPDRGLAVQGVRDGELLHLAPRREDWPELAYDDVVEVIAGGARRTGRSWGNEATRRCALAVTAALLAGCTALVLSAGPPWPVPAVTAYGLAAALAVAGLLLARAFSDADAGAVVAAVGLPLAFTGGALAVAPAGGDLTALGTASLLLGSASILVHGVIGYAAVAAGQRLFMAGIAVGVFGLLAAALSLIGLSPAGSAAVTLTVAIGLMPAYPLTATWIGRMPAPQLPDRPEAIMEDRPVPPRSDVYAAVTRSTELLTGLLFATAVTAAVAMTWVVVLDGGAAAWWLALTASVALLLRARLFALPRQRVPLLIGGMVGLGLLGLAATLGTHGTGRLLILLPLLGAASAVLAAGLAYSRRRPSPYLGRTADILDVVAIMALIPLTCAVTGLLGAIRDLFASLGG